MRGERVGAFADRCYRVLKLGQGEFVQAWGTEVMVPVERASELVDWVQRTNPERGALKRGKPRRHRLVNPYGVRFCTGRRGFLTPVRWIRDGSPSLVCTVELTEAVKNNRERNLGPRDNGKPSGKEIVAHWAEEFVKHFGSDGRVHWGQVHGAFGPEQLAVCYTQQEIDGWFDGFRTLNPYGVFDTAFARRLGFVERRRAQKDQPQPRYRGLGKPLREAVVVPAATPPTEEPPSDDEGSGQQGE